MANLILVALLQISAVGTDNNTFEQAYNQSLTTGRPLVVLIGATWCPGCQTMKNSTLPQVKEIGGLDRVIFFYIDFDRQRQLAMKLRRASSIPQLIRFERTATGWDVTFLVGAKSTQEVYDFINAGLLKKTKTSKVSMTKRTKGQSRQPVLTQVDATQKATPQTPRAVPADTAQAPKRKAYPVVTQAVKGPTIWRPLYNKPLQETKNKIENAAHQNDQTKIKR